VYGRDNLTGSAGLPGIWTGFLNQPPRSERNRVTPTLSRQLPKLLQEIGIARLHRIGRVGPYDLDEKSCDSGPTWEDYLAANSSLPTDYPRRVRSSSPSAPPRTRTGSRSSGPRTVSTWRCRASPMTASCARSSTATSYLTSERESRNLTEETLRTRTPPQAARGRRRTSE
jgi:hypothetical protein